MIRYSYNILFLFFSTLLLTSYTTPTSSPVSKPYAVTRVVIDAGHGGHDSGCLGSKTKEKDVALAIALRLGKYIEDNFKDVKVIYTRTTDKFVELYERASIANNAKADLFICIHCNSACVPSKKKKKKDICNDDIHGTEVWVMGLKKVDENLEVARRENNVVTMEKDYQQKYDGFDPNSPQANIIFTLYQNAYLEQSLRIAAYVEDEVKKGASRDGRGVKQAGFLVLYKTFMPSLLIETGFLTNKDEEQFLSSEKGQDKMACSIYNAFRNYKQGIESGRKEVKAVKEIPRSETRDSENVTPVLPEKSQKEKEISQAARTESPSDKNSNVKTKDTTVTLNNSHKEVIIKEKTKPSSVDKENPKLKPVANENAKDKSKSKAVKTENLKEKTGIPVSKSVSNNKEEIYFSVQFVTSPTPLKKASPKLKGETDYYTVQADGLYKYLNGHLHSIDDAIKLQGAMRDKGFKDAFVVAYKDTVRITIKEAKERLGN